MVRLLAVLAAFALGLGIFGFWLGSIVTSDIEAGSIGAQSRSPSSDRPVAPNSLTPPGGLTTTVTLSHEKAGVGRDATADLDAFDLPPPGLGAWTFDVIYNPSVLSPVGCLGRSECNVSFRFDRVRLAGADPFGLVGEARLAELLFFCHSLGFSVLDLTASVLADATPGGPLPVKANVFGGSVDCNDEFFCGDVDGSGSVTSIDAQLILQLDVGLIFGLPNEDIADVDGNGVVNSIDAQLILQLDVGLVDFLFC